MKKTVFALVIIALFLACSPAPSQNDFYGTWVGSIADQVGIIEFKFTFSADNLTIEGIFMKNDGETETLDGRMDITTWLETINANTSTRNDFPNGYILKLRREDGSITSLQIYMANNNDQIIILGIFADAIIYRRQ